MAIRSPSEIPIIQYWHNGKPPDYIAEQLETFAELNPEMDHLVFDESSAAEFLVTHFGPREVAAFEACAVPAMQADYFRYCAASPSGASVLTPITAAPTRSRPW